MLYPTFLQKDDICFMLTSSYSEFKATVKSHIKGYFVDVFLKVYLLYRTADETW